MSSRPVERSPQLNRPATPTRKHWLRLGAISTRNILFEIKMWVQVMAWGLWHQQASRTPTGTWLCARSNGAVIEPPEDADQQTKDLWKQHSELETKLRGEMGAQAAKRRKDNLASSEAAAKTAAELQAGAANR